jgi:putative secretion ATPase (PEP-CTERM system associated)
MYEQFFKINKKPFELLPNPDFLYPSKSHLRVIKYLDYGIRERAGFILLTGAVGSGKTTLIRNILRKYGKDNMIANVFNTNVNSEQLITTINDDFGLDIKGKNKASLLKDLNDFLIEKYSEGMNPILIIDEAQNLQTGLLEEIRMLSNLETSDTKLIQIILVGQPELRKILLHPGLRQLRQRIGISCHISQLMQSEVKEYICHRLEVAGNREAIKLSEKVIDNVYIFSRGIPRIINILFDFLMLAAFTEETKEITLEMVEDVTKELDVNNRYWHSDFLNNSISDSVSFNGETMNIMDKTGDGIVTGNISYRVGTEFLKRLSKVENRISEIHKGQKSCLLKKEKIINEIQIVKKINLKLLGNMRELKETSNKERLLLK